MPPLFPGGPGRVRSEADFQEIMRNLEERVFAVLPDETWVYPGHGDDTTLGRERPQLGHWRERGWQGQCPGGGDHEFQPVPGGRVCVKCEGRFEA